MDLNPGFLRDCRMQTMRDSIQECRQYLLDHNCFIVIDGLQSTQEWESIKGALGLETIKRHVILVITNEESVAKHCATEIKLVYNIKGLRVDHSLELLKQVSLLARSIIPLCIYLFFFQIRLHHVIEKNVLNKTRYMKIIYI